MSQQPEALRLADAWDAAISTRRHVSIGCEMAEELRRLHAENEALKANHKIVGYTTKPITWTSERHHSEQIVKITQRQQPEYGFTHAVFNAPQRREPLTDEQNRAAFADFVKKEMGDIAVMDAGRYISPKIQNYWSVWQFAHGIGDKP